MSKYLPPRYQKITSSVSAGGFGNAIKVLDTFLDREVLYKSMQNVGDNDQLVMEIKALSRARSRHVVEIYDVILDSKNQVQGIIIELLTGESFVDFHLSALAKPDKYLRALFQIATALTDLHRVKVVHRDLKLDNMKETASGILKLFDFGISSTTTDYMTKNSRGTLVYAAPELYEPNAILTPEMDVYAFGVCAWALCCHAFPPELSQRPPQSLSLAPSLKTIMGTLVNDDVLGLLDSCLDPNPKKRPKADFVSKRLAKELVRGQHRGIFVQNQYTTYELSDAKKTARVAIVGYGELKVYYTGISFVITAVTGNVMVNNTPAIVNSELPAACVLTFKNSADRKEYVPFSSSHPEVIL